MVVVVVGPCPPMGLPVDGAGVGAVVVVVVVTGVVDVDVAAGGVVVLLASLAASVFCLSHCSVLMPVLLINRCILSNFRSSNGAASSWDPKTSHRSKPNAGQDPII